METKIEIPKVYHELMQEKYRLARDSKAPKKTDYAVKVRVQYTLHGLFPVEIPTVDELGKMVVAVNYDICETSEFEIIEGPAQLY